jgi:hypothetical protein
MNPNAIRRSRWLVITVVSIGAIWACWQGIHRLTADETTGLQLVGPISSEDHSGPLWLASIGEPTTDALLQKPDAELYRFIYVPSFHRTVCVSAWKDGGQYWIKSTTLDLNQPSMGQLHWEKTRPLSARKWNRLRALFSKRSVVDPLSGKEASPGLDGSTWVLESVVNGKATSTKMWSPIRTSGIPRFQWISAEPGLEDFVEACREMLDYGKVIVPEIY